MAYNSRRGFAAMDPREQREISRRGGEHSHGGRRRNYDSDYDDYDYEDRDYDEYDEDDDEPRSRYDRYEEDDEDYDDRRGRYGQAEDDDWDERGRGRRWYRDEDDDDYGRNRSFGGRRGFASMPREEVRRIAARGGRASHGHGQGASSRISNGRRSRSSTRGQSWSGSSRSSRSGRRGYGGRSH